MTAPAPTALPEQLTVDALKRRVDKQLPGDDPLLEEYLIAALLQAQAPSPLGCGRNLKPEPALDSEGKDSGEPVTLSWTQRGRRIVVPDAREITRLVLGGQEVTNYTVAERNGYTVRLDLPTEPRLDWWWSLGADAWDYEPPVRTRRQVEVTGRFGFTFIPEDLAEAIYILAARAFYEREVQYADQVHLGEGAVTQTYFRQLPPRVKLAFEAYDLSPAIGGLR